MKTVSEIMELMGNRATEAEARAMLNLLVEKNLDPDEMSAREFFALIPDALIRANA